MKKYKEKFRYLDARLKIFFCLRFCYSLLFLLVLCLDREWIFSEGFWKIAMIFLLVLLVGFTYLWIWKPYRRLINQVQRFSDGYISLADLNDVDVAIAPELERMVRHMNKIVTATRTLDMSKRQAQYRALQNQINPHFLYNTLEAIRGDALCEGIDSIADTTEALSTFFRYTITDTGNLVSVEDELENVENYFKIQQYRFGDKLDMRVNFPDDYARILECKLPKLTLQPVVENAIFHGLEAKAEGGVIIISLEMTEKKLLINIHDDGIGIDEEELIKINQRLEITSGPLTEEKRKRGGIALPNVSRRIKLLFGDEYGIHIYSIPNLGTEVRISVPIITNREQRNQ